MLSDKRSRRRFQPSRLREARGELTREAVAIAANATARTVENWEAGKTQPTPDQLAAIAALTRKPLDFFFEPVRAAS